MDNHLQAVALALALAEYTNCSLVLVFWDCQKETTYGSSPDLSETGGGEREKQWPKSVPRHKKEREGLATAELPVIHFYIPHPSCLVQQKCSIFMVDGGFSPHQRAGGDQLFYQLISTEYISALVQAIFFFFLLLQNSSMGLLSTWMGDCLVPAGVVGGSTEHTHT